MIPRFPYKVKVEKLDDQDTVLTNFYFRYAGNIYVFSYNINGQRKHTFIDAGYLEYKDRILPVLKHYQIDLTQIENIIITHQHIDHCGLAYQLAQLSGARIVVHAGFKGFVEGDTTPQKKIWLGKLDPGLFQQCQLEYRTPDDKDLLKINGTQFPHLNDDIPIGASGKLKILACPHHDCSHSPDQLIVRYSQDSDINIGHSNKEMIFAGDLWLMTGPIIDRSLRMLPLVLKYGFFVFKEKLAGRKVVWDDPRDQDIDAKDALKKGFSVIRVKPGHGEEFLGCRIIPKAIFADRDLLVKLGYSITEDPDVLTTEENQQRIAEFNAKAYQDFVDELKYWVEVGATDKEISTRLRRIYLEQKGGGKLVALDRKQRRKRIQGILLQLKHDSSVPRQLQQIADLTDLS